jgi:hypothetical protein
VLTASDLTAAAADEGVVSVLVLSNAKIDVPYVTLGVAGSDGDVVSAAVCDWKLELFSLERVLVASLETRERALVLAVSVETAEKSDVVCSCDSKCDVSPTVDESENRLTLESPVDTESDTPVKSSEAARVACEAVVVSETCGRLVGDSVDG